MERPMIDIVLDIARGAGEKILEIYNDPALQHVEQKGDDSPLTLADRASHEYIVRELERHFPDIPVMSEEGVDIPYEERQHWDRFWCVDPMDGTKEFIKRTGQFTVNIALIDKSRPVLGVIFVPAEDIMYWADSGEAFVKRIAEGGGRRILSRTPELNKLAIVASKDHAGPKVQQLVKHFPGCTLKSMGSSLKFCLVAEGAADLYLRDVPTFEWDTAAAQAIVEAAGGRVVKLDGSPLTYNKEDLRNPALLTVGVDSAEGNEWIEWIEGID